MNSTRNEFSPKSNREIYEHHISEEDERVGSPKESARNPAHLPRGTLPGGASRNGRAYEGTVDLVRGTGRPADLNAAYKDPVSRTQQVRAADETTENISTLFESL